MSKISSDDTFIIAIGALNLKRKLEEDDENYLKK